jgi:hypothetical protein
MQEALKTQALLAAMINPEGATKQIQAYLDVAIPHDPEKAARKKARASADIEGFLSQGTAALANWQVSDKMG